MIKIDKKKILEIIDDLVEANEKITDITSTATLQEWIDLQLTKLRKAIEED